MRSSFSIKTIDLGRILQGCDPTNYTSVSCLSFGKYKREKMAIQLVSKPISALPPPIIPR